MSSPYSSPVRAISSLACLYIFRMLGLFMVLPVLALSGDEYTESTVFLLGVALGIYGLTQALLQIPFGLLSDRFGRKPLILIGLLLFASGSVIALCADSVWGLIAGRALQGAGAIAGVIMAMVSDLTSDKNRTKAMASIGASIGVAFALALIIGPWIASLHIANVTGVRLLFWATIGLSLIGILILLCWIPSVAATQQRVSQLSLHYVYAVLQNRQCGLLYVGVFVLHYVLMAIFIVIPLMLEQGGLDRSEHSWVYLGVMGLSFIIMIPLMIIGEKKQKVSLFFSFAITLILVSLVLIWAVPNGLASVVTSLAIFFIAFNYLEANLPSLLTKMLPPDSKGAGSGVFATCQFLGAAAGGIVGGALYSEWGLLGIVSSAVLLLIVWWFLARSMVIPRRTSPSNVVR